MAFPFLIKALMLAPQIFETGKRVYSAVTGDSQSDFGTPEELHDAIVHLPEDQQEQVIEAVMTKKIRYQELDTQRFAGLTDGDADKIKATARPQIALRCMRLMEMPFRLLSWVLITLIVLLSIEWVIEIFATLFSEDGTAYDVASPLGVFKEVVALFSWEGVLALLTPTFIASVRVITKYMGCRERDKAQEYEMLNGAPLSSSESTIVAAGNALTSLARLVKKGS